MQVTTEQIDPCKIALTVSVEPEKVEAAKEKAFGQFARNLQLPGFRKGKVPPQMARSYVDPGRVQQRAAEMLIQPAYVEALEETRVEPFDQPELESMDIQEDGSLVFKALVPLRPVVTLGPYKGLAIERLRLDVTDADVDRQIEELRGRQAAFNEVTDRTAQTGDVLFADLTADIEGQETPELAEPRPTVIEIGKNIPDFDEGLVGMAAGETKTIEAIYPETFADEAMRGKRATFTVAVKEIREKRLPDLDDAFAQKAHPNAQTVEELRAEIRAGLEKAAQEMADGSLEARLVGQIVQTSQINFPDVLLRAEMEDDARQLQERLERENASLEQYLQAVGRTREEVEAEMAGAADRRIRNSLVLSEVARAENITLEDADIDREFAERAERAKVSVAAVRAFVEKNQQMETIRNRALTKKVLQFLKDASEITDKVVNADEMAALAPAGEDDAATGDAAGSEAGELPVAQAAPARRRGKKAVAAEGDAGAAADEG